ncbi:hypothetical protein BC835DRAFT_1417798 [Cytidiella melzeri]|nr:hypothetical protein BC835DRAFT_1417798 [Cytidiella melzeri]
MSLQGRGDNAIIGSDSSDLYFNPFASAPQHSFSSAVKRTADSIGTRPMFRRRGSESSAAKRSRNDHDPWKDTSQPFATVHARSRTVDTVVGSSSGAKFHPLQTPQSQATGASSFRSVIADTRPRLKRLLSDMGPVLDGGQVESSDGEVVVRHNNAALKEKVVIVHEVTATDSLAGVALKYGISMADLRKANTLWTSDPIHLRKILYIPLDKSNKAKDLVLSQLETSGIEPMTSQDSPIQSPVPADVENSAILPSSSSLTIRRVPVSQLSFFPPASTSLHPSSTATSSRTVPRSSRSSRKRDPIPFEAAPSSSSAHSASPSSSLPSTSAFASALQALPPPTPPRAPIPSLTSLFSALPLSRISFESGTSTPSQVSEDQEHELDDVSTREGRQRGLLRQQDYWSYQGSRTHWKPPSGPRDSVELSHIPSLESSSHTSDHKSTLTPRSHRTSHYTSPDVNLLSSGPVRTSQPEPSPIMQLPLKSKRDP